MKKTAIILGATGLTGTHLLQLLLNDPEFEKVKSFSRKKTGITHSKLEEHIIDVLKLNEHSDKFTGDVVFCCIGTTRAKTPDKQLYRAIDYGIPSEAAKLAKQNGISRFIVISSLGANAKSKIFYSRLKGEMERDVLAQEIPQTFILRPSLITGKRNEKRTGENISTHVMRIFDFAFPKRYKAIDAKTIARAMAQLAKTDYPEKIIPSDEIKKIAKQYEH